MVAKFLGCRVVRVGGTDSRVPQDARAGDPDPWGKAEEGSEVGSPGSVLSLPTPRPLREGLFDQ